MPRVDGCVRVVHQGHLEYDPESTVFLRPIQHRQQIGPPDERQPLNLGDRVRSDNADDY